MGPSRRLLPTIENNLSHSFWKPFGAILHAISFKCRILWYRMPDWGHWRRSGSGRNWWKWPREITCSTKNDVCLSHDGAMRIRSSCTNLATTLCSRGSVERGKENALTVGQGDHLLRSGEPHLPWSQRACTSSSLKLQRHWSPDVPTSRRGEPGISSSSPTCGVLQLPCLNCLPEHCLN